VRWLPALLLVSCATAAPKFTLVSSEPVETTLDDGSLPAAYKVWPEMIGAAQTSIDLAEFYASDEGTSRLTPVVEAIRAALKRAVKVRFLADAGFAKTYPQILDQLARDGAQVIKWDVRAKTGGVLHAKYFIVDGKDAYLGSQNFDWRSLQHIEELGVRFSDPEAVAALESDFAYDWSIARGEQATAVENHSILTEDPEGMIPDRNSFELPKLLQLIDSARRSVRVQLLTYSETPELTLALQHAAARGVTVQLLTSDWELRPKTKAALQALSAERKILAIPQASGGLIPFARVAHAKYCVVDGERGWVGTSNWEPDYFEKSVNVGLIFESGEIPRQLERLFLRNWNSQYAKPFDEAMTPPKIG
jgi:phosphatidylserine/phosphatidylglycerophosphate/cardiolipin synthase-like enzyme